MLMILVMQKLHQVINSYTVNFYILKVLCISEPTMVGTYMVDNYVSVSYM